MATTYDYKDEFIVNSIDTDVLEAQELKSITEVNTLNVTEEPFKEKLVVYSVYMELSLMQLESEGMKEKYDSYRKEYDRYFNMAKTSTVTNVSNIPIGRG